MHARLILFLVGAGFYASKSQNCDELMIVELSGPPTTGRVTNFNRYEGFGLYFMSGQVQVG